MSRAACAAGTGRRDGSRDGDPVKESKAMSDPWSAPPARRSDPRQEARGRTLTGNPAGRGGPVDVGAAPEGFDPAPTASGVLRTRPAEPDHAHRAPAVRPLPCRRVSGPADPGAAGAQSPVTTGRRIAVLGTRGGSGRTTTTAVLARPSRPCGRTPWRLWTPAPAAARWGLRLGAEHAPALDAVAAALAGRIPASLAELARLMAPATANLLVTGPAAGPFSALPTLSPFPPPCPGIVRWRSTTPAPAPGLTEPPSGFRPACTRRSLAAPASVAGLEDALWHAGAWETDPRRRHLPLLTVITQTDAGGPFDPVAEAARLERAGVRALALRYDRHLAGGVELDLALLSRPVRREATTIAARILAAAGGHG